MLKIWIEKHFWLLLIGIFIFAFLTRIYRIDSVKEYIFDEVYHALTAKLIRRSDPRAFEWWNPAVEPNTAVDWLHPPLAKYTQALGMDVFGENSFGWRISSVVFGVMVIAMVAAITQTVFKSKPLTLLATGLASLDGLLLVQSRIAMNDIHVTFFILLTILAYYKYKTTEVPLKQKWLWITGIAVGLAIGSKWSGYFLLWTVWMLEIWFRIVAPEKKRSKLQAFQKILILVVVPLCIYLLSYTQMFMEGKTLICTGSQSLQGSCYCSQTHSLWVTQLEKLSGDHANSWGKLEERGGCARLISHFSELHNQIIYYQTHLKATHDYQSRPWQWFLDLRPVWMYVKYEGTNSANIYAQGNPLLFWAGDLSIFVTIGVLALFLFRTLQSSMKKIKPGRGSLAQRVASVSRSFAHTSDLTTSQGKLWYILLMYAIVWVPWTLSPRIMFFYHYTPAVPLLSILLAYWLRKVWFTMYGQIIVAVTVLLIVITFIMFYPNWTAMQVPAELTKLYSLIKSWR